MTRIKRFLCLLLSMLMVYTPSAQPAFDPVNDDTDIFLANPNIAAERPNVLIALDNTANWNQPFVNEKSALVQVINGLSEGFNVGLMMMPETGNPNDSTDGGYVRFHVRQMIGANKTNLASMVNNLNILNDKGNNATHGAMLYEAYLYYGGKQALSGDGKFKTDHDATTDPLLSGLTGHALPGTSGPPAMPTNNGIYRSPVVNGCQKNFIILISNGPADNNTTELAGVESKLATLTGQTPPNIIGLTPSGRQGNWADEMAKYMANADVNSSFTGDQNVITYVVEVNPGKTGLGPDWTAVMKSTALNGKGKYFGVTDDASGAAIVDALNTIFSEIQAVNTVFAASTLPISVNVQGTNLNQVYVGVFRPDAQKAPRWLGNLKMYQVAEDTATGTVFLADAAGTAAVNPSTGFITPGATSFWTAASSFWGFRPPEQNGQGGASDSPDGELVEKGGAAQQVRVTYPHAQTPQGLETLRTVYTCTNGGSFTSQCAPSGGAGAPGSSLSATPFADNNTDITTALLQLGTRLVSPLTGFATKTVSNLTDRRPVTLNNANLAGSVAVTSLTNGGATVGISDLRTSTPRVVTSISGSQQGTVTVNLAGAGIVKEGGAYRVTTAAGLSGVVAGSTVFTVTCTAGATATFNGLTVAQRTVSTVTSTTSYLIPGPSGSPKTCTAGTIKGPGPVKTSIIAVNLPGHGFTAGEQITIAGATTFPNLNGLTTGITVQDVDHFSFSPPPGGGVAGLELGTVTAAGNTTTATATSTAHGFLPIGGTITLVIYGANPNGYNGSVSAFIIDANTFRYTVGSALSPNTASPVYAVRNGTTTVTASTAPVTHGFSSGPVTIAGATIPEYNGTFTMTVVTATTFTYPTASVLPATGGTITASSTGGTLATVTATLPSHGFNVGDSITIDSTTSPGANVHEGNFAIASVTPPNTFTYSTGVALAAPTGSFTARSITDPKAFATVTLHAYATNDQILIAGATPAGYNGTKTITVVDANTFTYTVAAGIGVNTGVSVTSSIMSTTATATSVAHGFSNGDSVTIAGATPNAFNGTHTIGNVTANTFTYPIAPAQGDATGTITAAGTASNQRTSLIRWVRGEDNFADENANSSTTDIRASVHGDILHSRPAVINYGRTPNSENDVYVFYGANDGMFHAIKGGRAADAASTLQPGQEAWAFIAQEFFGQFQRMRNNSPAISSSFKKPYFMDGAIGIYVKDVNNDKKLVAADGDRAIIYISNHRGGRFIYALDVSSPENPKFMWRIDTSTSGFAELGQTWSTPVVIDVGLRGYPKPVVVFGGGYDPTVEDLVPTDITAFTTTSVTTAAGPFNRSMGRAIYVIDALTGALVWSAGKFAGATTPVADMHYAIPSDVALIKNPSGTLSHAYVGDTGGQMWRIDFNSSDPNNPAVQDLNGTAVTKIGSIADYTTVVNGVLPGLRKFMHAPDATSQDGFTAVLAGSGDREHPFDPISSLNTGVQNRFYMFKDKGTEAGPVTGTTVTDPTIVESAMFDATSNCIQDCTGQTQLDAQTALGNAHGWFIRLGTGEKVVGNALTVFGTTFFATNQPSTSAGGGVCGANLGIARLYAVAPADATSTTDFNSSGGLTGADRFQTLAGGGFPPNPVLGITTPIDGGGDGGSGTPPGLTPTLCIGVNCFKPAGVTFEARLRKFWYKEVDQ